LTALRAGLLVVRRAVPRRLPGQRRPGGRGLPPWPDPHGPAARGPGAPSLAGQHGLEPGHEDLRAGEVHEEPTRTGVRQRPQDVLLGSL